MIDQAAIVWVCDTKFLEIWINAQFSWKEHIEYASMTLSIQ